MGHQKHAAIAILDVGSMHDGVHQAALRVDENVPLLAFDLLAPHRSHAGRESRFFSAFHALAVDDRGGRRSLVLCSFAAFDIEGVMNAVERAVQLHRSK